MKRKRMMLLGLLLLFILLGVLYGIGNYFVNYAITPGAGGENRDVTPKYQVSDELEQRKDDNKKKEEDTIDKWMEQCETALVSIQSQDGLKLVANQYATSLPVADEDSHKWVILVHGYGSKKENMEGIGAEYAQKDFQVLIPDMRAHGESEGDYIGMGWLDRKDLLQWIEWVLEKDNQAEIVLHGVSMGAATVMMTSGEELPEQVKAIVEDCGYTSVWDIFASELKARFGLPPFPVLHASRLVAKMRAGYDFKDASALEQIKKSKTPMLLIHGSQDDFVPTEMIYPLFDAVTGKKEMLIVEGAGHAEANLVDPELYYQTVFDFLSSYINIP